MKILVVMAKIEELQARSVERIFDSPIITEFDETIEEATAIDNILVTTNLSLIGRGRKRITPKTRNDLSKRIVSPKTNIL